ncbi:hypothetical protein PV326_005425 [Microctonus aethiopoides]|nr:hypothetical protein PV326_005425 [Microctonus aethiopoides]
MTLYFDIRVQNTETASINTHAHWHSNIPLLAIAAYSQDKGGFVTIYDDQGEPVEHIKVSSGYSVAPVTALGWHPDRRLIVTGWENGEIKVWSSDTGNNEFNNTISPHKDSITLIQWSPHGGILISADSGGSVVGWKINSRSELFIIFHHELKHLFIYVAFKLVPEINVNINFNDDVDKIGGAVGDDERALNLFSTWRPRTAAPPNIFHSRKDNHAFYIGSTNGIIYYIDAEGQCTEVYNTGGLNLHCLLYHQTRDSLVIMTEGLNIGYLLSDSATGRLTELNRVKLSGKNDMSKSNATLCWITNNTLAILNGQLDITCWNVYTGDAHVLSPSTSSGLAENMATPQEICTSISYCKINETLAAGTNLGTIYLWKRQQISNNTDEFGWPIVPKSCIVHGTVKQLTWGGAILRNPILAVNCITNVFILHQQMMCASYNDDTWVSQTFPTQLLIETGDNQVHTLKADIQIQILAINSNFIVISSCKQIAVYRIDRNGSLITFVEQQTFNCDTEKILIYETTLIILTPISIQLRSIDGNVLQTLPSLPEEGEPITMELTGPYLTVASLNGILKIWDISKREAKLHTRALIVHEVINDFAEIIDAKCNLDCRCVSITVAMSNLLPSSIMYIWDIEGDEIFEYDFAKLSDKNINDHGKLTTISKSNARLVTAHCWDTVDPRLLVCRAQKTEIRSTKGSAKGSTEMVDINSEADVVLVSLFVTSEHGIAIRDIRPMDDANCRLLGVKSPYIIILNPDQMENENGSKVMQLIMREFEELGSCDDATKKAIMDFSFHLSMANMDEAFKSIKAINNETVWKSLAKMCVKTKQLDMAVLCLGHMKHVRGVRSLREAMKNSTLNLDAKIGILASELGLYDDAERLFYQAKRLDLLSDLLEGCNKYNESMTLSASHNKIREKLSCYNYAKLLEQQGDIAKAIEMFTKSDCHYFEVPRMLLNQPNELQRYLANTDSLRIKNWHAQYVESMGDMEGALRLYDEAKDTLAVTRLLCYLGREDQVNEIVTKTNHAASAYHLAAHYESINNPSQAVHFYTMAKAYNNAIRICKENGMTEELWPLAMLASRQSQIDVAKYYEENEQPDKAVLLYHKAALLPKALDLAFSTQQYDALQLITMDINADSDPELIQKCADFFVKNRQIDKAVELLATGKKYNEVLNLIQEHNIILNEDLAEKMTIVKMDNDIERERMRILILEKIGEIAFEQGNYHLATKKFTQAGNKLRAMKALLKSGDTEKICFFAQVSRQRDIYIMAGNYLQSLDWQNQPDILKNILNFYSKAKAMDLLANFYVACAQVEIDEFQNYEKALDALNQASRCLAKVTNAQDNEVHKRAVEVVNIRMATIKRYLDIKKSFDRGESEAAVYQLRQLIDAHGSNLEQSVRRGDLFATITQHYVNIGDMEKARSSIEELKRLVPSINLSYYYNSNLLEALGYRIHNQREEESLYEKDDGIEELLGE